MSALDQQCQNAAGLLARREPDRFRRGDLGVALTDDLAQRLTIALWTKPKRRRRSRRFRRRARPLSERGRCAAHLALSASRFGTLASPFRHGHAIGPACPPTGCSNIMWITPGAFPGGRCPVRPRARSVPRLAERGHAPADHGCGRHATVRAIPSSAGRRSRRWPRARDEEVLSEWAGLGYYARARNLIACAREVATRGGFPDTEDELRKLPGIGDYTAAAIAAIAFGRRRW